VSQTPKEERKGGGMRGMGLNVLRSLWPHTALLYQARGNSSRLNKFSRWANTIETRTSTMHCLCINTLASGTKLLLGKRSGRSAVCRMTKRYGSQASRSVSYNLLKGGAIGLLNPVKGMDFKGWTLTSVKYYCIQTCR
jgi:hypothetical protein